MSKSLIFFFDTWSTSSHTALQCPVAVSRTVEYHDNRKQKPTPPCEFVTGQPHHQNQTQSVRIERASTFCQDPLGDHSDAAIWQALKRTRFIESMLQTASTSTAADANGSESTSVVVEDTGSSTTAESTQYSEGGVSSDMVVADGAGDFSVGQRQLLCIARPVLRRSKVVFSTASIDNELDAKIQRIIREELDGATLLTIAHRLKTIIDFDKVLVLNHSSVVESGTPHELLQEDVNGSLRSIALETGELELLIEIAKSVYDINGICKCVSAILFLWEAASLNAV
ncbi:P-loop containing nucleoside triphosphate hydrolase protein [Cladochytrium replicatum]|nr:P-loop containing nucleoside triphosphate hydrolase protein [Cladochytrium replicatum]